MFPPQLRKFYSEVEKIARESGIIAGKSGRHMKYPYTYSAKIAQFPFFFYFKNNWVWMYYPPALLVSLYFFGKIHALVNSEANVKSWAESQRKAAEKEAHH